MSEAFAECEEAPFVLPKIASHAIKDGGLPIFKLLVEWASLLAEVSASVSDGDPEERRSAVDDFTLYLSSFADLLHFQEETQGLPAADIVSPYAVLGVSAGATEKELRAAYRGKVQQWHPDRLENMAPELRAFANERLAQINAAYEELLNNARQ